MNRELQQREKIMIMAGAMLTLLLAALDNTIVGTAMPKIIRDLHGMEHYSWPFTSYLLMSTIILPISGKLADIYGRKRITLIGIAFFVAASLLCGLSGNMIVLSIFRGLQGIGGGVCISSAFIMVAEIFPVRKRGKYMGIVASMFAVASILGPGAGGFITDHLSWRWIFYVNIPLGIIAFLLISYCLPHIIHHQEKRRIDLAGVLAFVLAAVPFLLAVSWTGTRSFFSADIIFLLILSLVMLVIFLKIENRSKEPLLSLHFFNEKIFTSSVIAASLSNMAIFGTIMFLPLYLQSVRGINATHTGIIMMPMMVSMIVFSNICGVITSRFSRYKSVGASGLLLSFAGMLLLGIYGSTSGIPEIMLFSAMAGAGAGSTFPVFNVAAQCVFSQREVGMVTSILQFFRNLGGAIGSAVFGSILLMRIHAEMASLSVSRIPADIVLAASNPRVFTDPEKIATLRAQVPASVLDDFNTLIADSLKGFSSSIEMIFVIASVILFAAFLSTLIMFDEDKVRKAVDEHKNYK